MWRNSKRITYGNEDEENQKLMLSLACVDLLSCVSRIPELRGSLRNEDTLRGFQEIVKNEDKLHLLARTLEALAVPIR